MPSVDLSVNIGSLEMKNPVTTASGTFGQGDLFQPFFDVNELGALTTKSVSLEMRPGNPPPRIAETPSGYLNAIGLQNPGVDAFIEKYKDWFFKLSTPLIVSIAGVTPEEYATVAKKLDDHLNIGAFELNISCPNVREEGLQFACSETGAASVVSAVRQQTNKPLITKLTPNTDNNIPVAKACADAGSDGIAAINTLKAMAIDIKTRKPKLGNVMGGLSGPAIKPVALRWVFELSQNIDIPILAMGGIQAANDAIEFIIAGATAVAVGTANFYNPKAPLEVIKGIETYLENNQMKSIVQLRKSLILPH